jgi:hypothetical protein
MARHFLIRAKIPSLNPSLLQAFPSVTLHREGLEEISQHFLIRMLVCSGGSGGGVKIIAPTMFNEKVEIPD